MSSSHTAEAPQLSWSIDNLADLLEYRAQEDPTSIAIFQPDSSDLTFNELFERAEKIADQLVRAGLRAGDRVALFAEGSPDYLVWLFACWKARCCAVPNNTALRAPELVHVLNDSRARVLVVGAGLVKEAEVAANETGIPIWMVSDEAPTKEIPQLVGDPAGTSDDCMILYTSGTTGRPKGALRSHAATIGSLQSHASGMAGSQGPLSYGGKQSAPGIICLPIANTGGIFTILFAFWVGRPIVLMSKFVSEEFVRLANMYQPTNIFMTPSMYQMLTQLPDGYSLPESIRFGISGGAPLPAAMARRFEVRYGIPIIQVYGGTETGFMAGGLPRDIATGVHRPGAIGKPYPGVELSIRGADGAQMPAGEVGEIYCKSQGLIKEYVNRAEESDAVIRDGWLVTGDLGYLDSDGYLYLVGRARDMMICGGFNVYPAEVEEAISNHPDVDLVAVFAEPDERLGEVPHAVFTRREGSDLTAQTLLEFTRTQLAHWKAPRVIFRIKEMPVLFNGKIARLELANLIKNAEDQSSTTSTGSRK
jgi:long-chain acyl-CoA synthetase